MSNSDAPERDKTPLDPRTIVMWSLWMLMLIRIVPTIQIITDGVHLERLGTIAIQDTINVLALYYAVRWPYKKM